MVRCMANNYSTLGFWRSWHRSYNLWIVRYIYIPLGGSKNPIPSTLLVFTFVALWHDLSFKLLTWGWLVTFFVLPEMIARKLIPEKKVSALSFPSTITNFLAVLMPCLLLFHCQFGSTSWYRHLSAIGGVANVLMMMTANLVGFAIGVDGVKYMWDQILGSWEGKSTNSLSVFDVVQSCSIDDPSQHLSLFCSGVRFMVGTCFVLFTGVQVMFEYRLVLFEEACFAIRVHRLTFSLLVCTTTPLSLAISFLLHRTEKRSYGMVSLESVDEKCLCCTICSFLSEFQLFQ